MRILKVGEKVPKLYGVEVDFITDEMITALRKGKRLYVSVNDEYSLVIRYKKNGDKREAR